MSSHSQGIRCPLASAPEATATANAGNVIVECLLITKEQHPTMAGGEWTQDHLWTTIFSFPGLYSFVLLSLLMQHDKILSQIFVADKCWR